MYYSGINQIIGHFSIRRKINSGELKVTENNVKSEVTTILLFNGIGKKDGRGKYSY